MSKSKNVMLKIKEARKIINPYYDMRISEIQEIVNQVSGKFGLVVCGFEYGYLKGMRAAKAEMKRGANYDE